MSIEQRERIVTRYIEDEMKDSFINYSMSVITSRALPDVRDGLKPVHRRILYAMHEQGLTPNRPFKKSATVVGDVLGKYHPHGDSAVYDSLVRMVQDFSLRYPLINGQGNFGSIDGDPAAAYRYTESRLLRVSMDMLADIEKETVDFQPNFDERLEEPKVLPSKVPNLLINGSSGIAVGMATNIPPHNLNEVIDGCLALIDNPEIEIDELYRIIPGPDFPTGGYIYGMEGIREAYHTGRGRIKVRARAYTETKKSGRESIIISEIPYMVNKSKLLEDMAGLVRDKKVEGISDIRDESDRDGMRIVVELKRDALAEVILNQFYSKTQLQTTFGSIFLALVDGMPKVLNLKQLLEHYIDHRHDVVTRRARFELKKAEERAHILEGLKIAIDNLDEVIEIIRSSRETEIARSRLMERFDLSEIQAQAILDLRLARLTGLEREKLDNEYAELIKTIERLRGILDNRSLRMQIVKDELAEMKQIYGDERRTEILVDSGDFDIEDLIAEEEMVITISHLGYIKRLPVTTYRRQARGGRGKSGQSTRETDFLEHMFIASTHDYILFFTTRGHMFWLKVHEIPQAGRTAQGKAIVNLLEIDKEDSIAAMLPVRTFDDEHYVVMATRKGTIKKTVLSAFCHPRRNGIRAMNIPGDDTVIEVKITDGTNDIILATRHGQAIRFPEDKVRNMGRTAYGVRGIRIEGQDFIIGMVVVKREATLLVVSENGLGKRSHISDYRVTNRGGKGIITLRTTERTGLLVAIKEAVDTEEIILITVQGLIIRLPIGSINVTGRNTMGVKLINLNEGDRVVDVARIVPDETTNGDQQDEVEQDGEDEDGGQAPDGPADTAGTPPEQ
ncbi:MAG: DNA gyrase subunit A [Gemmatimonadota bacterium]|nr:DNA gyrase subunit A [Gemmatimonadota bacterium]